MKTFEEFARDIIPDIDKRYELYKLCQTPEKLIGLKVISIRAGFSSLFSTKMTITEINQQDWGKTGLWVTFKPNEDTTGYAANSENGWLCHLDELPHSVKPY